MRAVLLVFTCALTLAACGGTDSSDEKTPAPPEAAGTDLGAIKTYLLDHTQRLQGDVAALRESAQRYHDLAEQAGFDGKRLLADHRDEVAGLLGDAKRTFREANPAYGEKLEAVVGLVAIGVLLLITNWFFHRVYWSEWIGRFHRQRRKLLVKETAGFWSAQALGLLVLGLTSVYREGFETVLFLQSLELSAGATAVIEGAALGLALTLGVAVRTFALQRKLPYKRMLIATGGLIGLVLVVMVGQTARTMQGTGWLTITPLDWELPSSLGLWLGVFPSVETLGAQIAAITFVLGSYALATELKLKRPQRRARRQQVDAEAVGV